MVAILIIIVLNISVKAHIDILDVTYDNCITDLGDGVDEKWYDLIWFDSVSRTSISHHIPSNIETIKYFIEDDSDLDWTNEIGEHKNEILAALNAGIQMWNDVYFYDMESGITIKKKIITLIEGTENDNNIIIREETSDYLGYTLPDFSSITLETNVNGEYLHKHYSDWEIFINVEEILRRSNNDYTFISRNIAHEIGHILGLCDVDQNENSNSNDWHHEEILMGYAENGNLLSRQQNITYKDLAGVAITRGFHTDEDHQWLNMGLQHDGTYKFVCSICNGVVFDAQYYNYLFHEYGSCNGNHTLLSNNMMAVGCKGDKDYIKCKYCRYVAPLEDMVTQNYTYQSVDSLTHRIINNVNGLNYMITEAHNFAYLNYSTTQHKSTCTCGKIVYERHSITEADYTDGDNIAICIQCRRIVNLNDGMFPVLPLSRTKYSINGSYILPNGIVVLVDEDIQSYLNNTLIFYEEEELPQLE